MSTALGLSIGATNLVAARVGRPPVARRAVLTLFDHRPPEVGVPGENPALNQPGVVLSGFVERVGDPVPLVAEDGSSHRAERVLVEALDAMARTVGGGTPVAIAVPAHWGPAVVGALRGALRDKPNLAPGGVPATLIPDSVAALTALAAAPGLPAGVIALVDLGGSGTSITLANADAGLTPIGETVRYAEFSGDHIDQAVLNHVLAGVADANNADPAGTAAVGSLAKLRDESRQAKERLSADTATAVPVDLPGFRSDVRLTRTEVDNLIAAPLAGLLVAVGETLERNGIAPANLAAVATVGGGAAIPLVTQRLSEQFRVPVITTPQSQRNVAAGAALLADQDMGAADAPTGLSAAADAATGIAPTAWAAGAAGLAAGESAADGAPSATHRALAWSQDDAPGDEPVPYTGADYSADVYSGPTDARPPMDFVPGEESPYEPEPAPLPWYKRPPILFAAAAAAAVLAIGGLAITLTGNSGVLGPVTETSTTFSIGPSSEPPPTSAAPTTVTVTGSDGQPTTTIVTPPPPPPSSSTTTTTSPTTTSSTTTTTTTTTTTSTTTTTTTTSRTTTTTTTSPPAPKPEPEPEPEPEPAPANG